MRPWIRRYLVVLDLCPRRETKLGNLQGKINIQNKTSFLSKSKVPKCNFMIRPCKPKWIERNKYETLSSSSKIFGSNKNIQRAAAAEGRRPLCMFFSDLKLFRLVLKSRTFSFQSILACRGSQKLHFGDLGLT